MYIHTKGMAIKDTARIIYFTTRLNDRRAAPSTTGPFVFMEIRVTKLN